jgi:hypothetical protein
MSRALWADSHKRVQFLCLSPAATANSAGRLPTRMLERPDDLRMQIQLKRVKSLASAAIIVAAGFSNLCCGGEALADCAPNGLCCLQWRMEVSGPHGKDVLLDNTYAALVAERDHRQQSNQRWCVQGDKNFCDITFGEPQCWGNQVPAPSQSPRQNCTISALRRCSDVCNGEYGMLCFPGTVCNPQTHRCEKTSP